MGGRQQLPYDTEHIRFGRRELCGYTDAVLREDGVHINFYFVEDIFFTLCKKCDNITKAISYRTNYAPVAQGIEHRPPEAGAAVRIRPGVYLKKCLQWRESYESKMERLLRPAEEV